LVANGATNKRANRKTIVIISQKGGAGKTTISIHLAVAAEKRGMKTALFDLDPQASASSWSDKRNKPSPTVVSAQATRLPGLLEEAAAQSADLVARDSDLRGVRSWRWEGQRGPARVHVARGSGSRPAEQPGRLMATPHRRAAWLDGRGSGK
jgi:hypothetical protein